MFGLFYHKELRLITFSPINYNALSISLHELPTLLPDPIRLPISYQIPFPSVKLIKMDRVFSFKH
jgi:hypothetical protein